MTDRILTRSDIERYLRDSTSRVVIAHVEDPVRKTIRAVRAALKAMRIPRGSRVDVRTAPMHVDGWGGDFSSIDGLAQSIRHNRSLEGWASGGTFEVGVYAVNVYIDGELTDTNVYVIVQARGADDPRLSAPKPAVDTADLEALTFGDFTVEQTSPSAHGYIAYRTEFGPGALFIQGSRAGCVAEAKRLAARRAAARRLIAARVVKAAPLASVDATPAPTPAPTRRKATDAPSDHPRWNAPKVACPFCDAGVGEACKTRAGRAIALFHGARVTLANG